MNSGNEYHSLSSKCRDLNRKASLRCCNGMFLVTAGWIWTKCKVEGKWSYFLWQFHQITTSVNRNRNGALWLGVSCMLNHCISESMPGENTSVSAGVTNIVGESFVICYWFIINATVTWERENKLRSTSQMVGCIFLYFSSFICASILVILCNRYHPSDSLVQCNCSSWTQHIYL